MKKKDSNPVDKKKKQGNPQKEKLEEKPKDKKNIPKVLSLEKSNPPALNSKETKEKNNNKLAELISNGLSRKKSEQKYKVDRLLEDKQGKKDKKPRVFSHSPEHLVNQQNPKANLKPKTLQQKNLTERKFTPAIKSDNLKSPNTLKIPKQTILKSDIHENKPSVKFEEKKNEEPKENKENKDIKELKEKNKENKEKQIIENIEIE